MCAVALEILGRKIRLRPEPNILGEVSDQGAGLVTVTESDVVCKTGSSIESDVPCFQALIPGFRVCPAVTGCAGPCLSRNDTKIF